MYDIITIGSAVQDIFLQSKDFLVMKSPKFKTGLGECFSYGSKIEIKDLRVDIGGGATNASVTFANLGFKAGVFSYVGNDLEGQYIINGMAEYGVETRLLRVHPKLQTGRSIILMTASGDRTVLTYRGASGEFSARHIHESTFQTKWIYLTSVGGNLSFIRSLLQFARAHEIRVAWNPGSEELAAGLKKLGSLMRNVDVVILNTEEAAALASCSVTNVKTMLRVLEKYPRVAVTISASKKGAYVASDGRRVFAKAIASVKVVNTTGAGDAFGSGFVAGLMLKNDAEYAIRVAMANSQTVIQKMGAKNGLLEHLPHPYMSKTLISEIRSH
ncbi:MAG: carbohydrate kinase family protein [Candidatus Kerfeldbacteria bacterium]|nr:carbohydrate kinase family protein [Candidatus Kerfeldbacteria bacterium]